MRRVNPALLVAIAGAGWSVSAPACELAGLVSPPTPLLDPGHKHKRARGPMSQSKRRRRNKWSK